MTIDANASSPASINITPPSRWACVLLGIVMIVAGFLVLGDIALFTVVSAIFFGWMAIAVGLFEIVHAFWTKGWGGFFWQIFLGILYFAFGIALVTQPLTGALVLTYILGFVLMVSGIARILLGFRFWKQSGWIMVVSGIFGCIAGLIVLTGFPATGLWVLGFLLGIDLLSHGVSWIGYALRSTSQPA